MRRKLFRKLTRCGKQRRVDIAMSSGFVNWILFLTHILHHCQEQALRPVPQENSSIVEQAGEPVPKREGREEKRKSSRVLRVRCAPQCTYEYPQCGYPICGAVNQSESQAKIK